MQTTIKRTYNVNRLVQIEALTGMVFQAESGGHLFEISGIDNAGEAVALSGTVSGVFLRPDNTDVALTGSVSGGVVSVPLKAECYAVPGRFGLTLYISAGGSKTAIYAAMGTVSRTSSGQVAPTVTADVVDLVNRIAAAVNSIPATYTDLQADIAPTYSDTAVYAVGQFAWYNGDLKRCKTAITTPETYTAAHWENGVLGNDLNADITGLKSALTTTKNLLFEIGTLSGGKAAENTKYARTAAFYEITKGAPIVFSGSTKLLRCVVYFYNSANENDVLQAIDQFDIPVGGHYTVAAPEDCYFKFRVTWIPQADITSADLTLFSQLFSYYLPESYERIENLQEQITEEKNINTAQQVQLDSAIPIIQMDDLEIGGITQGNNTTDNRYVRSATYYPVNKGETVQMKSSSEFQYRIAFYIYNQNGGDSTTLITLSPDYNISKNGQDGSYIVPATGYLRFRAVAIPAEPVTTERLNAFKVLMSYQKYNFIGTIDDEIADKTRSYNVLSINHRGYSAAPENTLVAFKQSKIHGFNYIETDVRFTSDGVAVLLHDASINRTARNEDGTAISGTVNIADITYEQALTYDFGIYKGNEYAGTKIPTYEAFLSLCRNISLIPVIELKAGTREQVYALYDLAAQYGLKNKAIWLSQTFTYLAYIRDHSDATLVYCRSTYTPDTQYLKTDGNKVIAGLPSAGITAETVLACIAADYEIWQYTIEIASDISANQYVTGYLTNTIDVGETLYNQAIT